MFTGIIERTGLVKQIIQDNDNIHITIEADFAQELKIDQSVAHNGCCLTVVSKDDSSYVVTAIKETMLKTNLGQWREGTKVNLERSMQMGGRLDGHIVQGHVDTTARCTNVEDENGSWKFTFQYVSSLVTVEKGSVTINGTSLTVVDSMLNQFSVCVIPYTYEFTNFHTLKTGDLVNLEFDIIGKYVARLLETQGIIQPMK